jgi:hypothetical protein
MVAEAPAWVHEELVKWMRAFFWAGKKEVNGGQCMVAWDTICKPIQLGGLGVKDLRLQGLALRVRWCWLRRTDPARLARKGSRAESHDARVDVECGWCVCGSAKG